jgi:hypothetical protein
MFTNVLMPFRERALQNTGRVRGTAERSPFGAAMVEAGPSSVAGTVYIPSCRHDDLTQNPACGASETLIVSSMSARGQE